MKDAILVSNFTKVTETAVNASAQAIRVIAVFRPRSVNLSLLQLRERNLLNKVKRAENVAFVICFAYYVLEVVKAGITFVSMNFQEPS